MKNEIIKRQYGITRNGVYYEVEMSVNMDALAVLMVNNAARNKTGKATEVCRAIGAKVINTPGKA